MVRIDEANDPSLARPFAERTIQVDADENFAGRRGAQAGRGGDHIGSGENGRLKFIWNTGGLESFP